MAPKYNISKVKQICTSFKTRLSSWGNVLCDGYLLEIDPSWYKQCEIARLTKPDFNPDTIDKTYDLLAISLIGQKHSIESVLRAQSTIDVYLQTPSNHGEQSNSKPFRKHQFFCVGPRKDAKLETESEHVASHSASLVLITKEKELPRMDITVTGMSGTAETGYRHVLTLSAGTPDLLQKAIYHLESFGTVSDVQKFVTGSLYRRTVAINPKIKAENLNGDSTEGYLIGESLAQARDQFWNVLNKLSAPVQPEWEDELWKRFTASGSARLTGVDINKWRKEHDISDAEFALLLDMQPWVDELIGHRMHGYKLQLNKDAIQILLSALVYCDILPNVIPATSKTDVEPDAEVPAEAHITLLAA